MIPPAEQKARVPVREEGSFGYSRVLGNRLSERKTWTVTYTNNPECFFYLTENDLYG